MISKNEFLLNEDIYFLNNGSYGACPKTVFTEYQNWQRRLEYQPVEHFQKDLLPALQVSREKLGEFINADPMDMILIKNATYASNLIIRSLDLKEDDEIIVTNQEYGACMNAWRFWQQEKGFKLKTIEFDIPLPDSEAIVDKFRSAINCNTKAIYFSHITSLTAQIFPLKELAELAQEYNILSIVDGAHSIGQYPLNMSEIEVDFFYSNIHKWLYAPKGTAFFYGKRSKQHLIKPLITGWGWGDDRELLCGSDFIDFNQFYGTDDLSSFLTIPDAIKFYIDNEVINLKKDCNELVKYFIDEANKLTGMHTLYKQFPKELMLGVIEVPKKYEAQELKSILYDKYKIEIPVIEWNGKLMIRISVQIFTTKADVDYLLGVIKQIF